VPLGKLHSERFVPVDEETQRVVARIVELGTLTPIPEHQPQTFLLPRYWQPVTWYKVLHNTLRDMARTAGCSGRVNPHRLRHSFATEMVRLGVSLPALMRIMGHRDIRMTLRYVEVVQLDLQREFHRAREKTASSTRSPNSQFSLLPRGLISLPFVRPLSPPTVPSNYSSPSWKIRTAVNFADSHSGFSTSTTNSITSPQK